MGYVTDSDIENYLNMEGAASKFSAAAQNATAMTQIKANADAMIAGHLPFKFMTFTYMASGLYLTRNADDGQTEFTIPEILRNVTASASYVWVNHCGVYRDRNIRDAVGFTISVDNTTLTLDEPLAEGDVVIADLAYTGANRPQILKKLALDIAVNDLVTRKPSLVNDPIIIAQYERNFVMAEKLLGKIKTGRLLIEEWERLDVIPENRVASPEGRGFLIPGFVVTE